MAAQRVIVDGVPAAIGGGVEQISLVQPHMNLHRFTEDKLMEEWPALWMPMIDTANVVADRYNVSREAQDEYSLQSQQRTAAAQQAGKFADEIVPMDVVWAKPNKETGEVEMVDYTVDRDECNRPTTTLESLAGLAPVRGEGTFITAGNASQLTDGASACLVMDSKEAEKRNIEPTRYLQRLPGCGVIPMKWVSARSLLFRVCWNVRALRSTISICGTQRSVCLSGSVLP